MNYNDSSKTLKLRAEWTKAIEENFNAERMAELKRQFDLSCRADANYHLLYDGQREIFLAELEERRKELRAELEVLSKSELANRIGFLDGPPKNWTKEELITGYIFSHDSDDLESEHSRVLRIWSTMTEEEKTK